MAGRAWDIYLNVTEVEGGVTTTGREWQDTVFFDDTCDADYVYRSLVDHDGFDPGIELEPQGIERCIACDGATLPKQEICPHCGSNLCYGRDSVAPYVYDAKMREDGNAAKWIVATAT